MAVLTFDSVMSQLNEMRSHFDSGFSASERDTIDKYSRLFLHKPVKNLTCGDCYKDAFVEIRATLQRLGALPELRNYKLKEGCRLHIFGHSEYVTNPSDEQAERFLAQDPSLIAYFQDYPFDWEERIGKRKNLLNAGKLRAARRKAKEEAKKTTEEDN